MINVSRKIELTPKNIFNALNRVIPFLVTILLTYVWLFNSQLLQGSFNDQPEIILEFWLCNSAIFSYSIGRLIVAHITKSPFNGWDISMLLFTIPTLNVIVYNLFE